MSSLLKQPIIRARGLPAGAPRGPLRRGWDWPTALLLTFSAALLVVVSHAALGHWVSEYRQPESYYAHAPAVPLIVALMLWHRREALQAVPKVPCYGALGVLIPALALLVFATKQEMPAVEGLAFLVSLWSCVWLVLGTRFLLAAAFPLGFLLCMAPLPGPLLNDATFGVQQLSTRGAVGVLRLFLFQPGLAGNVITLDNYTVFVDVPCSGFKLLLSLLTCSATLAYLLDGPPLKRLGLFLLGIPLSLAVNVSRLTLLCVVGDSFGSHAGHVFHDWDGLLTLLAGTVVLFLVAKGIGCRTFAGWPLF